MIASCGQSLAVRRYVLTFECDSFWKWQHRVEKHSQVKRCTHFWKWFLLKVTASCREALTGEGISTHYWKWQHHVDKHSQVRGLVTEKNQKLCVNCRLYHLAGKLWIELRNKAYRSTLKILDFLYFVLIDSKLIKKQRILKQSCKDLFIWTELPIV